MVALIDEPRDRAYEAAFEDMPRRALHISKIQAPVGYQRTVELDEFLARIIEYFRQS